MRSFFLLLAAASLTACASPILRASAEGRNDEVTALLANGANIEDKSATGCGAYPPGIRNHAGSETPLICAAINGRLDTVKLLLAKGADVNARDFLGRSALDYATGNPAVAEVLRAKMGYAPAVPPPASAPEAKPAVAEKPWWKQ